MSRFELGSKVKLSALSNSIYKGRTGVIVGKKDFYMKNGVDTSYDIIFGDEVAKDFNDFWFELTEEENNKVPFMHFELPKEQKENEMIPTYIGYKNRTVTLVWSDGSKTQAIAKENEEVYFLYGFLIAYYKKVNEQLSSKEIQHRLENIVYLREKEFQYGYLTSVFRENCGLSIRKQDQFIAKYIYSIAPFEIEQENFAKTYKIDDRFRT